MRKLEEAIANLETKTLSDNIECNECRAENETLLKYMKNYKKLCDIIQNSFCSKIFCNDCQFSTGDYDCIVYDYIAWQSKFRV